MIAARTASTISSQSPIRVQFVDAQIQTSQAGETAPDGIFKFEPAIEGLAVWSTTNCSFVPTSRCPRDKPTAPPSTKKAIEDEEALTWPFR